MNKNKKRNLVVYYSMQGSTMRVAEVIAEIADADIILIKPRVNYNLATSVVVGVPQILAKKAPKLADYDIKLEEYDCIYLGTPVWQYTFTPPLRSFIKENSLEGKDILLFSTHAGDNGKTFEDLRGLLKNANVLGAKDFVGAKKKDRVSLKAEVLSWIHSATAHHRKIR